MNNNVLVKEKTAYAIAWYIDNLYSGIHFKIDHFGISEVLGNFREFEGFLQLSKENPEENHIKLEVNTNSIFTANRLRDKHLLSSDFFDAARHPKITFEAYNCFKEGGNNFLIPGDLTIKGVTRRVEFRAKYIGRISDLWSNNAEVFRVSGKFNRQDFDINYKGVLDGDLCLLGNHVEINMLIQLKK